MFLLPRLMYRKEQKEEVFSVKADFSPVYSNAVLL